MNTKVVIQGFTEPKKPKPVATDAPLRDRVVYAIRNVFDPELPVNVYDLGLIYHMAIDDSGNVNIDMTLTAPNCPVADSILQDVKQKVAAVEGVQSATVTLVWEPKWTQDRMTKAAKLELGLL